MRLLTLEQGPISHTEATRNFLAKIQRPENMIPNSKSPWDGYEWKHPDAAIAWLFRGRCCIEGPKCCHYGSEVNEIIPRSRGKEMIKDWKNRVLVCHVCHREYHDRGVNDKTIGQMQSKRKEFLIKIGREEYI